jgi:glycosyltransferase involved in cell wall biosynthesis
MNRGKIYLPGPVALFLDSIAKNVEYLILFLHEVPVEEYSNNDIPLSQNNISLVNLGKIKPAWHRTLFHRAICSKIEYHAMSFDFLILRSPSPLVHAISRIKLLQDKIVFLIVGDYAEGAKHMPSSTIRQNVVIAYNQWMDRMLTKAVKDKIIFVNSRILYEKYLYTSNRLHEIRTTTLSESDFFQRKDTCRGSEIKLLYTGRIDWLKGLKELLQALKILRNTGIPATLHLVGWEENKSRPVEMGLMVLAEELNLQEFVHFHGSKKLGPELNVIYRSCDVYVLPSYHEGFPRSIWEAMANSLPVVTTSVGSIPYFIEDRKNALIVAPKDHIELASAIEEVIKNAELRQNMIRAAFDLSTENTLDKQAKRLIDNLNMYLNTISV